MYNIYSTITCEYVLLSDVCSTTALVVLLKFRQHNVYTYKISKKKKTVYLL